MTTVPSEKGRRTAGPHQMTQGDEAMGIRFILSLLLVGSVLAGCATLPPVKGTEEPRSVTEGRVNFPTASLSMPVTLTGYLYRPEGTGPFPAMVLLHTIGGLRPHVFNWAEWLKAEGYVALAVDSFSPRGIDPIRVARMEIRPPGIPIHVEDAFGAEGYLRSLPFVDKERIGVMGWSYGAMAALQAASGLYANLAQAAGSRFRAAVAFYPDCGYFADTRIPLLLLLGEADDWTPPGQCVREAKRLQQAGQTVILKVYPGVHHGFDQAELGAGARIARGRYTLKYDSLAFADARERVRAFLGQYVPQVP